MTSLSPMLQSMISTQSSGAYNKVQPHTMPAPAPQTAAPKTPLQNEQTNAVKLDSQNPKKTKSKLGKRLLTGLGIGGTLGFAGGTAGAVGISRLYEKAYLNDKSQLLAKEFVKYLDKFGQKLSGSAYDLLGEFLNAEKGTTRDGLLKCPEMADDFVNFISDTAKNNKYKIGAYVAGAGALIGLGIGTIVHNVKKHKEAKADL